MKKTHAQETLSATLTVHVYVEGGPDRGGVPACAGTQCPSETQPLRISRLGPNGEVVSSVETAEHTIHVSPGTYEILALGRYVSGVDVGFTSTTEAVGAGQELEVTLKIAAK